MAQLMEHKSQWLDGIKTDFQKRWASYSSDWTDIYSSKILSSSIFIFFTSIAPAVTFSLYMTQSTQGELGAIEILLATALTGIVFSIFGGQPMVILGVTGPVAILIASVYTLSQQWGLKFIPFLAWSQIWAGLMHLVLSAGNFCAYLQYVTQFSCDTFGVLIALIYLYTGFEGIYNMLTDASTASSLATGYFQVIVAMGTVWVAVFLVGARQWLWFNEPLRLFVSDYGATIAIVTWSLITAYVRSDASTNQVLETVPMLFIPQEFVTTSGRGWFVDLTDIPVWGVFASIFPGFIITVLFFFDHNVSSIMAQHRDFQLKKGSAFHWDFFILGICVILTGVLGIPPTNGLIPQAPLHTKSLMVKSQKVKSQAHVSHMPHELDRKCTIDHIYEQRVTNLSQSLLIGLALFYPFSFFLRRIPTAVLYGLFLYLGLESLEDNEFASRISLWFLEAPMHHHLPPNIRKLIAMVPSDTVTRFTIIQVCLCGVIFVSTFTSAGVIFPVLIGLLVVLRERIFPSMYRSDDLNWLDKPVLHEDEQLALKTCGKGQKPAVTLVSKLTEIKSPIFEDEEDHC